MLTKKLCGLLLILLVSAIATAEDSALLNPQHPDSYTVVKGDTLWDIAGRFLNKPWRWPEVWKGNPQIKNPDLIYPGDVITLTYKNGKPELSATRGSERGSTVKLSPQVREEPFAQAIPTIPIGAIQQFLTRTRIVTREEFDSAPYIVSSAGEHLISATDGRIYVKGITAGANPAPMEFSILRLGPAYHDHPAGAHTESTASAREPEKISSGDMPGPADTSISSATTKAEENILGYEGVYVGSAKLAVAGDPATFIVKHSTREVLNGDRLFPVEQDEIKQNFMPHAPDKLLEGRIISIVDGVARIGRYQAVAINLGSQDGVEVGHVFAAYRAGEVVRNDVTEERGDTVQLPNERTGVVMVFRTYDRVSYALVMKATGALKIDDVVKNP